MFLRLLQLVVQLLTPHHLVVVEHSQLVQQLISQEQLHTNGNVKQQLQLHVGLMSLVVLVDLTQELHILTSQQRHLHTQVLQVMH